MLANFSEVELKRAKFRKRKNVYLCCVHLHTIKRAREIRKFHVGVMQRRLQNVQKCVRHVQRCCFANQTYCFFAVLVAVAVVFA